MKHRDTHASGATDGGAEITRRGFWRRLWRWSGQVTGLAAVALGAATLRGAQRAAPEVFLPDAAVAEARARGGLSREGLWVIARPGAETPTVLSLTCPHLGCEVSRATDHFECPCHGSRFDAAGGLVRGPASAGLRRLRPRRVDGGWMIRKTTSADA